MFLGGGVPRRWCSWEAALTFAGGDRDVRDQGVQFVGGVLVLVTLPGQTHAEPVRHVPEDGGDGLTSGLGPVNTFTTVQGIH